MSRDEVRIISEIVGGDKTYLHFAHRINKEFENADEDRNSRVHVLFEDDEFGNHIGFCVIGESPAKMKTWEKFFIDEGWVAPGYKIPKNSLELMYMYIKPKFRGMGRGQKLFKKALAFAKKNLAQKVFAYVSDQNDIALRFYAKMKANIVKDISEEGFTTAFLNWNLV